MNAITKSGGHVWRGCVKRTTGRWIHCADALNGAQLCHRPTVATHEPTKPSPKPAPPSSPKPTTPSSPKAVSSSFITNVATVQCSGTAHSECLVNRVLRVTNHACTLSQIPSICSAPDYTPTLALSSLLLQALSPIPPSSHSLQPPLEPGLPEEPKELHTHKDPGRACPEKSSGWRNAHFPIYLDACFTWTSTGPAPSTGASQQQW